MSTQALVSVIMPSKDAERFIEAAIRSVLEQTHQVLQLIVVDDGSSDRTCEIINTFVKTDQRVALIRLPNNSGGPAKPRNLGLTQAKGEFIAFIDADDVWLPNKLAVQLSIMREHNLNFCSTGHRHFKDDAVLAKANTLQAPARAEFAAGTIKRINHALILRKNRIVTSSVLLSTDFLEHLHFSEQAHFVAIEDYLAWLHLHQQPNIKSAIIQTPLVFYRTRSDSISSSKVVMAKKIFKLLSLYEVNGKRLGVRRFYYFATYLVGGIKALFAGWRNRVET